MKFPVVKSRMDTNWIKHCGFLDLSVSQFMSIQESLLIQQIEKMSHCSLGRKIMGRHVPQGSKEYRRLVHLTKYEDYIPELDQRDESSLPEKPYTWAHTSGGGASFRKVPVSREANRKYLDHLMTAFILACSKSRGCSSVAEGDRVLFNVAPKPYLSGILADGASANFNMRPIISPDDHDGMDFKEKMARGFETSLRTGMDILVAMTGVLVKTGEEFDKRSRSRKSRTRQSLTRPGEMSRIIRAYLRSKLEKRNILPRDIWKLKALICWGIDTDVYSEQVYKYWGAYPYQFHACTEAGIIAVQAWNRKGMTFLPDSNFYEFIPEEEWAKSREDIFYEPETVLLSDVIPGHRYELVITSFHGMPFIRYRLGHLIRITSLEDQDTQVRLPQMVFEARADDLIDIAGFTRVSEKSISKAISSSGIRCEDWLARKEIQDGKPALHIYMEVSPDYHRDNLASILNNELIKTDPGYRDLTLMMEIQPLQLTILKNDSFNSFTQARRSAGLELAQQKPPRMNALESDILELTGLNAQQSVHS
jgi:hypothetical protein